MSKYGNRKMEFDGYAFDSQGEARRWAELKLLQRAKEISGLQRQVPYELQPKYETATGRKVKPITYIVDFRYEENGEIVCEDFKGAETEVFKLKAKLFGYVYPDIELRITR